MNRREFTRGLIAGSTAMAAGTSAHGQDLGKLLEGKLRDSIRKGLEPPPADRPVASKAGDPHPLRTADGWTLVAHRYKPTGKPRTAAPVILCHGLTYNALFWDLDPAYSFARYLSSAGYDVWSVSLRGCGLSQKWVWKLDDAPGQIFGEAMRRMTQGKMNSTGYATIDPKYANWTMDDHISRDVPAFINFVRKKTGANDVTWVGHSMGGIVAIAMLARYRNPGIGRLIAVGSQVTMPNGQIVRQYFDSLMTGRASQLSGQIDASKAVEIGQSGMQEMFFNVKNTDPKVFEALSTWATDVPSVGLMKQYTALANRGELLDASGSYSYARNLANLQVPCLFACGAVDRFAPPEVQKFLHARVGSTDKTLRVFGKAGGFQVDAGHDDSLVGLNSKAQVYPVLEKWIAERST